MIDLTGKRAIVTGGAQGVGGGITRQLAKAGARVLVADIDYPTATETVELIRKAGGIASVSYTHLTLPTKA